MHERVPRTSWIFNARHNHYGDVLKRVPKGVARIARKCNPTILRSAETHEKVFVQARELVLARQTADAWPLPGDPLNTAPFQQDHVKGSLQQRSL